MKVCFISHSSEKWGAERALIELIDALKKRGVDCYVILPRDGPIVDELKKLSVTFSIIPYGAWAREPLPIWKRVGKTVLNLGRSIRVALRIKRWGCDVAYTNTITVFVGALASKLVRVPHVWHIHELGLKEHGIVFYLGRRFSFWLMDLFSSVCIANSKATAEMCLHYINPSKLRISYYSVDISNCIFGEQTVTRARAERVIKCVNVGQVEEGKRQDEAILAIEELVHMGIRAELVIVGDGKPDYQRRLFDLVNEKKLDDYVEFAGWIENPLPFFQNADVVLMCSRGEAFGRVTIEAMKVGKPVIGARSGGTIELIRDGFNGFLYTPGNYKELAEKIKYLYENNDHAQRMGRNGHQWASQQFTQDRYGEEVLAILREVVSS